MGEFLKLFLMLMYEKGSLKYGHVKGILSVFMRIADICVRTEFRIFDIFLYI